MEEKPPYTPTQLSQYKNYISLPSKYYSSSPTSPPVKDLAYLTALHTHQISRIPYENLSHHYSKTHTISLDPQVLFQKIVGDERGRGGYCMENALFFNCVLRSLGFEAYTVAVRVRVREGNVPRGDYIGWTHILNIMHLPSYPFPFALDTDSNSSNIHHNLGTQEIRLLHSTIPHQRLKNKKFWIYQYRNGAEKEWNSYYAFNENDEFLPNDWEVVNWFASTNEGVWGWQTRMVCVVEFVRGEGEEKGEGIKGKVMLVQGEVKRNMGGKTEVVKRCKTEEEKEGIRGRNVELVGGVEGL